MSKKHTGKLPGQLELAVSMKAMVTMNIATKADLANGMRGEIVDIVLDQGSSILTGMRKPALWRAYQTG
jgi:hypothetical protein